MRAYIIKIDLCINLVKTYHLIAIKNSDLKLTPHLGAPLAMAVNHDDGGAGVSGIQIQEAKSLDMASFCKTNSVMASFMKYGDDFYGG